MRTARYVLDDTYYSLEELASLLDRRLLRQPALACGTGLPRRDVVYIFEDSGALEEWLLSQQKDMFAPALERLSVNREEARSVEGGDTARLRARQKAMAGRILEDLEVLSVATGQPLNSRELFVRATVQASALEGPIFDPAIVWTGPNYTGRALPVTLPYVDLTEWPEMNNSVSSLRGLGITVLYDRPFFRGASLYAVGAPFVELSDLANVSPSFGGLPNFNNRTSSINAGPLWEPWPFTLPDDPVGDEPW
ncbi:hypothetical protein ACI78R_07845 [Geodermatophilus sp. SYSU D01106]